MSSLLLLAVLGQFDGGAGAGGGAVAGGGVGSPTSPCLAQYVKAHPADCTPLNAPTCPPDEAHACNSVASQAVFDLKDRIAAAASHSPSSGVSSAAVQPIHSTAASAGATPLQVDAAESVKTVGLVGVSAGVSGQSTGPSGQTSGVSGTIALDLNPFGIAAADSPESFAQLARLTDLTLVVPGSIVSGTVPNFFGVRLKADFWGFLSGGKLYADAEAAVAAHRAELVAAGTLNTELRKALASLPPDTRAGCVAQLQVNPPNLEAIDTACGTNLSTAANAAVDTDLALTKQLQKLRAEADDGQGGVDLEADIPLSSSSPVPLRLALVGVAGVRTSGSKWRVGGLLNLGADYTRAGDMTPLTGAGAGGGAVAFSGTADGTIVGHDVHASVGLKWHFGQSLPSLGLPPGLSSINEPGTYTNLEVGLSVPLGQSGAALALRLIWPFAGPDRGPPTVTTNIDYSHLLQVLGLGGKT